MKTLTARITFLMLGTMLGLVLLGVRAAFAIGIAADPVPEPSTLLLVGAGMISAAAWSKRNGRGK